MDVGSLCTSLVYLGLYLLPGVVQNVPEDHFRSFPCKEPSFDGPLAPATTADQGYLPF